MNNFQKQFMVSQRAIARKYAQPEQSPDSPSEKTVTQTVWSGLTVFRWPKSIYWYHPVSFTEGRLYIYLDLENLYINIPRAESPRKYFWFRHPRPKVKGEISSRGQSQIFKTQVQDIRSRMILFSALGFSIKMNFMKINVADKIFSRQINLRHYLYLGF